MAGSGTSGSLAIAAALLGLAGCATIMSGTTQKIAVTSMPPGAVVTAEPGTYQVTAPGTLVLRRKDAPYRVTFTLDGYEPYHVVIRADSNGWTWGNLIFGGLIGIVVDSSTGADSVLSPEALHANLVKVGLVAPSEPSGAVGRDGVFVFTKDGALLAVLDLE